MASSKTQAKGDATEAKGSKDSKAPAKAKAKAADKPAADAKKAKAKKGGKPSFPERVRTYFSGVRTEVRRVVWPTKAELVKYSVAVVAMLVFFGVLIAIVDSAVLPALYAFSGLRG